MDQVHVIRHKVLIEGISIRAVAREMGVSRNTVRKYLQESEPVRKCLVLRRKPVMEAVEGSLEGVLRSSGRLAAVGVTAAVFTAVHLPDMWGSWPGVVGIFPGAVALAELRIRTGSLLAPMIGHASYNAALVALAAIMSS